MRYRTIVALVVALAGVACGGGSSPSPTPAPTSLTVYASTDNRVTTATSDPKASDTAVQGGMIAVGWQSNEYGTFGAGTAFRINPPSQIAGRTITKATFRLTVSDPPREVPATPQLRLSAFAAEWSPSTITWNIWTALACHATGEVRVAAQSSPGPLDFDVTTIVQGWASGTVSNYGLRLMVDQPAPGMMGTLGITWFYSLVVSNVQNERPQLLIEYQ